ncbi:MAG: LysM peptidoglycan-binding domain-containing protein [Chloroflexi bacterium]|nr:MAG: LysM peptidoglycan-binding domain-containing protein [Chloroflexota bacterium]
MAEDHSTDHSRLSNPEDNPTFSDDLITQTAPRQASRSPLPQMEPDALFEPATKSSQRRWNEIWEGLLRLGLGETALRTGTIIASIALILLVLWVMGSFYLKGEVASNQGSVMAAPLPTETPTVPPPPFKLPAAALVEGGIPRFAELHTTLPNQARYEMTQYEVENGDTIFGIAEKFGLKPQSILWGNFDILADDPHRLQPGQMLNILPVDGVLYEWHAGDGLNGVSKFFGVSPEDIINWPGNNLSAEKVGELTNPAIDAGTKLFVPGGSRPFISWSAPLISRNDPAKAKIFGPGFCGTMMDGYIGAGTFVWPSSEKWLSGYDFSPGTNHWGVDIAGDSGNPIYATDSGVVVYAGWNDWGYGNAIVIDHGNGWQSLYGHLSELYVSCGSSVSQGATIATMGSTGRSSGPHLHFELMNASGVRVNPWDFLIK